MEFTTVTKKIYSVTNFISKVEDLEFIVSMKFFININVSEGKRVCPLVARLNPEWKCKEWEEERIQTIDFFGFDPNKISDDQ